MVHAVVRHKIARHRIVSSQYGFTHRSTYCVLNEAQVSRTPAREAIAIASVFSSPVACWQLLVIAALKISRFLIQTECQFHYITCSCSMPINAGIFFTMFEPRGSFNSNVRAIEMPAKVFCKCVKFCCVVAADVNGTFYCTINNASIPMSLVCNGQANCADRSDESSFACSKYMQTNHWLPF